MFKLIVRNKESKIAERQVLNFYSSHQSKDILNPTAIIIND